MEAKEIWKGPFGEWPALSDEASGAWALGGWMDRQVSFFDIAHGAKLTDPPPRPTHLPMVAPLLRPDSILDFGGGSGWVFEVLRNHRISCPPCRQYVAEVEQACLRFRELLPGQLETDFVPFSEISSIGHIDLIYANASLHYARSIVNFLDAIEPLTPSAILLDGYVANSSVAFFMTQYVYGDRVPVAVPVLEESLGILQSRGFRITFCVPMLGPSQNATDYYLPLKHLESPFDETLRYSILAERRS